MPVIFCGDPQRQSSRRRPGARHETGASGLRIIAGEALSAGVGESMNQVLNDNRWDGLPRSEMRPSIS